MTTIVVLLMLVQQASTDTLTLEGALRSARALRGSPAGASAGVALARAQLRVAGSVPNPVGGYSHTEATPRQHVILGQSLEWLLTRGTDRGAGRATLRVALADSAQAAADLEAQVRLAFFGAIAAVEVEQLTRDQQVLADSLVRLADARLARGDIPRLEEEQLTLEAYRAGQRHARAAEGAEVGKAILAGAIGLGGQGPALVLNGDLTEGLDRSAIDGGSTPVFTYMLGSAIADSEAAALRLRSSRRARLPMPTLQVGADWDDPATRGKLLGVFGLSLPLPWWQHGAGATALAAAESDRRNARLREVRGAEAQRLEETGIRLRYAAERALVARDSLLPLARQIRGKARIAYESGESGLTQLVEALRNERDVAAEAVDDLLAWQESLAAWHQVRGTGR